MINKLVLLRIFYKKSAKFCLFLHPFLCVFTYLQIFWLKDIGHNIPRIWVKKPVHCEEYIPVHESQSHIWQKKLVSVENWCKQRRITHTSWINVKHMIYDLNVKNNCSHQLTLGLFALLFNDKFHMHWWKFSYTFYPKNNSKFFFLFDVKSYQNLDRMEQLSSFQIFLWYSKPICLPYIFQTCI